MKTALIVSALLIVFTANAQQNRRLILQADLSDLFFDAAGLVIEYRGKSDKSFELQAHYQSHPAPPPEAGVFNGDWSNYYAERRLDTLHGYFNQVLATSGWEYLTDSRPLPDVPEFLSVSTLHLSLGLRFNFEKKKSPWAFFLRPGLSATGHRFYEIQESTIPEKYIETTWTFGAPPQEYRVKQRTIAYRQVRSSRLKDAWSLGLRYDAGVRRSIGRRFLLEGRIDAGANLWLPYDELPPKGRANRLWINPSLWVGWRIF